MSVSHRFGPERVKNHKNIGLIHFGNYDFTTIDIDKKTKPYTKINSLEFIPLTHDNLKNVEIINKDISTRIINTYYPEYLPIGSKVNAEFIISKLETINNNEQQKNNTAPLKPKKPAPLKPKKPASLIPKKAVEPKSVSENIHTIDAEK